jgi:hypothetical protein
MGFSLAFWNWHRYSLAIGEFAKIRKEPLVIFWPYQICFASPKMIAPKLARSAAKTSKQCSAGSRDSMRINPNGPNGLADTPRLVHRPTQDLNYQRLLTIAQYQQFPRVAMALIVVVGPHVNPIEM